MISASDRQECLRLIEETLQLGGNLASACDALGIGQSTYFRWKKLEKQTGSLEDRRPTAELPEPKSKLTPEEEAKVIEVLNSPEFTDLPPSQIVPSLAERGIYLCSVSTMYRILQEHKLCKHRTQPGCHRSGKFPRTRLLGQIRYGHATTRTSFWTFSADLLSVGRCGRSN